MVGKLNKWLRITNKTLKTYKPYHLAGNGIVESAVRDIVRLLYLIVQIDEELDLETVITEKRKKQRTNYGITIYNF